MLKRGWLLDANVDREQDALVLWVKSEGKTRGYYYHEFLPSVFVDTGPEKNDYWKNDRILRVLHEHQDIVRTEVVEKRVSVYDEKMRSVVEVFIRPGVFRQVAGDLERLPKATVFHADMYPVQQFFITNDIFPFGRVEFESSEGVITAIHCLDHREDVEYETPDLEVVMLEAIVDTEFLSPRMEDPIHHFTLRHRSRTIRIDDLDEREMLLQLQQTIDEIDPDVIVTRGGDEELFRYLTLRAKINDVTLTFSRDKSPLNVAYRAPSSFWAYNQVVFRPGNQVMFRGRIHIDSTRGGGSPADRGRIEGIIEGCRLAHAPPQRVARMSIGTVNAAVQYYNAFKMDILIPPVKRNPEYLKSINQLVTIDKGGLIFQPRPDIYEDVAECDFTSMYPTLMVSRNISPETICTKSTCKEKNEGDCVDVPGLHFKICMKRKGIVARSLELVVDKRSKFKRLIQQGVHAGKYKLMQNTLKGVLVSCFGYLGFKNARFGRVEAHTAVCAFARDVLLRTQDIAEELGLEVVHGIVDSIWLTSPTGIDHAVIEEFCSRVGDAANIEMTPNGVMKWMVIPSSRLHPSIAPLNRYYGVFRNGTIKTRGIETRRRDTCLYVGDCQKEMIKTLAQGDSKQEFIELIPNAYAVCQDFIDRLYEENVDIRDLVLHSRLTREPHEYRANSRAAIVAKQLLKAGKELHAGQRVKYVLVNADSPNPLRRVTALEMLDSSSNYDSGAYAKLCTRAFKSLIPAQYLDYSGLDESERLVQTIR